MNIGIIGSRRRDGVADAEATANAVFGIIKRAGREVDFTIVSGGCPKGGDRFAEDIAKQMSIPIIIHQPQWHRYGRGAGFVRNTYIADDSDVLIACVAEDRKGGTEDTIKKFLKRLKADEATAKSAGFLILV